jgi:hypothetical protein
MDAVTLTLLAIAVLIGIVAVVIFAIVFLAAFLGEPLSNSQEDFEESDALIKSTRKISE